MIHRRPRLDANHADLVRTLQSLGVFVQTLAPLGSGCPDILCGFRGLWYVAEIKDGTKPPSARKLTDDEIGWHTIARLHAPVHVWKNLDDALKTLGL